MRIQAQFVQNNEKSILTAAFHADVKDFAGAEAKLAGQPSGSFLTFSVNGQNYCSAVGKSSEIRHNPFRWDVSGNWYNGAPEAYATEMELLNHLVDGAYPNPVYN